VYGEFNGVFAIETLEMIEGDLPLTPIIHPAMAALTKRIKPMNLPPH
jgi:hypothetical protein